MAAPLASITLSLVDLRPVTDRKSALYVLLTAEDVTGLGNIAANTVTALSDIPGAEISFTTITSGRLYVGLEPFPNPPVPYGSSCYGWIELTRTPDDEGVWLNLSNVDLLALPLSVAGRLTGGATYSLGFKTPVSTLMSQVQTSALVPGPAGLTAVLKAWTGQTMIAGPTIAPQAYRPFDPYVDTLTNASAPLLLTSDTPAGGAALTMSGSFLAAGSAFDPVVSLTSAAGDTLQITAANLTSAIIYRCDGGTLTFNGQIYPQNRTAANDPFGDPAQQVITNSLFRNLMIGLNEGYFTTAGPNDSTQFAGQVPFATGYGNPYAKVIHAGSNSYGYPYADDNLKVLVTADPSEPIVVSVLSQSMAEGYSADPAGTAANQPATGTYQFGIGAGSGALGPIRIGNWVYPANASGAFGGFLPALPDWTKMVFAGLGPDHFIWVRDGQIDAGTSLTALGAWDPTGTVYAWPADLAWVSGATPPAYPGPVPL